MSYPHPEQTPTGWEPPAGNPAGAHPGRPAPFDPPPPGFSGGPPPAYGELPSKTKRRRPRWPWLLLGGILLVAAAAGGCSVLLLRAVSPSIDAANEWVALLDEQRWDEANDNLCASARQGQSDGEIVALLQSDFGPDIDDYRLARYNNINGAVSIGGTVTIGGDQRPLTLRMSDADGDWQVCGYSFTEIDSGP